jgi:hypothetical protein
MKRVLFSFLVACAVAQAAGAAPGPKVAFRSYAPLRLAGTGFAPHHSVRVVVSWTDGRLAKRLETDGRGRFAVRWPASVRRYVCHGLVAVVVTPAGPRIVVRPPAALCAAVPVPTPTPG